ncbi:hypothetical protein [Parabacteroides chinchillae]|uniref:Uncharacterized protein n=1 Tax=Parabacteroides chinchillae TaxID=871327 RepID=A0A8G2BWK2_9BACT|nr:hypothetical protein [Parabacteroides chinchillae]SEF82022.1 hypothetical protein SAMN05444001_107162 [Parabacteroides chinchillae]
MVAQFKENFFDNYSTEDVRIEATLRAIAIENESKKVKINWNC